MKRTIQCILFSFFCFLPLAGCFTAEAPLIPPGAGVLPIDGETWIGTEDYSPAKPQADGYVIQTGDRPEGLIRFQPLLIANAKQYYLAEAPTGEESGGYFFGVARRTTHTEANVQVIQIALMDCSKLPSPLHETMRQSGWVFPDDGTALCTPPNLSTLKSLFQNYLTTEMLEDETWWDIENH